MAVNERGIYFSSKLYGIKGIMDAGEKTATFDKAPRDEVYSGERQSWLEQSEGNNREEFEDFEEQGDDHELQKAHFKGFMSNGRWVQIRELCRTETEQLELEPGTKSMVRLVLMVFTEKWEHSTTEFLSCQTDLF